MYIIVINFFKIIHVKNLSATIKYVLIYTLFVSYNMKLLINQWITDYEKL